jgi:membrane associated rhomboid family serine protease
VTAQYRAGVADGEYYRLFTNMFVHYGLIHLALNMWALWVLGRELEARLGPTRFLTLYLVAGLGGGVACYLFTPAAQSAGASGAIYGLFGALFVVFRKLNLNTSYIVGILAFNLFLSFRVPGISIAAHLGGLATGTLVGVALAYAPKAMRNRILVASVVGLALIFGALVALQTANLSSLPPLPPGV